VPWLSVSVESRRISVIADRDFAARVWFGTVEDSHGGDRGSCIP
jgi:hypothetical protein